MDTNTAIPPQLIELSTQLLGDWWAGGVHHIAMLDKGMIQTSVRQSGAVRDFITILRMVCNLKLMNCLFLETSI